MIEISPDEFPSASKFVKACWAPILLQPIIGSPEQFVIAVVAVNGSGFTVQTANALDRLGCLYGAASEGVIETIKIGLEYLSSDLSERGLVALTQPQGIFCGITSGGLRNGEGETIEQIALSWLKTLSSLNREAELLEQPVLEVSSFVSAASDPLPLQVYNYVLENRPSLASDRSKDIADRRDRRSRGAAHKLIIDYSGSKLVANFGEVGASLTNSSMDRLKRKLWDLAVSRDEFEDGPFARAHEFYIQHPSYDDPTLSSRQVDNLFSSMTALEKQADIEEIRLRAFSSVPAIGKQLLMAEAA